MEHELQTVLGIVTGVALSAACGYRVFVPMLVASLAVRSGAIEVAQGFEWIGSWPALACFGAATVFEIAGYYLPGVDHFLDVVASPAAVVAGTVLCASFITDVDPWLRWSLALVAGGGAAAAVQAATVATRAMTSFATFGLGNPLVATGELASAGLISTSAVVVPLVALACVAALAIWFVVRRSRRAAADVAVRGAVGV